MDRRETNGTAGGNQITEKVCLSVCLFQYWQYVVSIYLYVVLLGPEFVEFYRDG